MLQSKILQYPTVLSDASRLKVPVILETRRHIIVPRLLDKLQLNNQQHMGQKRERWRRS
jgi:hypothetical protein